MVCPCGQVETAEVTLSDAFLRDADELFDDAPLVGALEV